MQLLLAHWHCILPALIIIGALIFMRDKDSTKKDRNDTMEGAVTIPQNDD